MTSIDGMPSPTPRAKRSFFFRPAGNCRLPTNQDHTDHLPALESKLGTGRWIEADILLGHGARATASKNSANGPRTISYGDTNADAPTLPRSPLALFLERATEEPGVHPSVKHDLVRQKPGIARPRGSLRLLRGERHHGEVVKDFHFGIVIKGCRGTARSHHPQTLIQ